MEELAREQMATAVTLKVPLEVSVVLAPAETPQLTRKAVMTQAGDEGEELAGRCRALWFGLVEQRQLWKAGKWGRLTPSLPIDALASMAHRELDRLTESGTHLAFGLRLDTFGDPSGTDVKFEWSKPLLLNIVDATYGPKRVPRAFIKMANPLVLADSLSQVHCHFGGSIITPAEGLVLLHNAGVNESAGIVAIYPTDLDGAEFNLMMDLIGLRLQFPPKTAISVSSDKVWGASLTAVLSGVNQCCQEFGFPELTQTGLPAAMLDQRTSSPRVARRRAGQPETPGRPDPGNPLAPPPPTAGYDGRPRRHP